MKLLVIALLVIGVFFAYQMLVGTVRHSYQFCVDQATTAQLAVENSTCGAKRMVYEDLIRCVTTVQKDSFAGSALYSVFGTKNDVTLLIDAHNNECKQSKVLIPKDGIYLNY